MVPLSFRSGSPDSDLTGVVLRYYLYTATATVGFVVPVWVLLLESRGLTFTQITLMDAVFLGTITLSELPTGYVGDRIGRRNALVVSSLTVGVAVTLFGLAHEVWEFLAVYVVWAVAVTFRSGNDSAWLYDTLSASGEEGSFARIRGRGMTVTFTSLAVASLVGGAAYEVDPRLPFAASGVLNVVSAAVVLGFSEPDVEGGDDAFSVPEAANAVRRLLTGSLRRGVLYVALLFGVGWTVGLFVQPLSTRAGLSPGNLGVLYAGLTGASAVATVAAGRLDDRIGLARWLAVAPAVVGLFLLAPLVHPLAAVPAFVALRMGLEATRPLFEQYLNDRTPSLGRATTLSAAGMAFAVVEVVVKLGAGPLADAAGIIATVAALGGVLLALSAVGWLLGSPLRADEVAGVAGRPGDGTRS